MTQYRIRTFNVQSGRQRGLITFPRETSRATAFEACEILNERLPKLGSGERVAYQVQESQNGLFWRAAAPPDPMAKPEPSIVLEALRGSETAHTAPSHPEVPGSGYEPLSGDPDVPGHHLRTAAQWLMWEGKGGSHPIG